MGSVLVVELTGLKHIGKENLLKASIPEGTKRLILKTDNSDLIAKDRFEENFCYLTEDGAKYLLEKGIKLVGIDYLSIAEYGKGEVVHRALLSSGIVIIEGLDLRGVPAGIYQMTALPLKIAGCDGAPARVVLIP
jgi:arylformamidase